MEDKTKRGGAAVVFALAVVLLVLPLIYVLSIGPVARMVDERWISQSWEPTLEFAYAPLLLTADSSPTAESVLTGYMEMWVRPNQGYAAPLPNLVPPPIVPTSPIIQPSSPPSAKPSATALETTPPE
jgi:hypothetical protein